MTRLFQRVLDIVNIYRSAVAAAAAYEGGRRPLPNDLRRLGIDVAAFGAIARA